jgi:hypothetical protein
MPGAVERVSEVIWKISEDAFEDGRKKERERIIELLKPYAEHNELCEQGCYSEDCSAPSYQNAIALIRKEIK